MIIACDFDDTLMNTKNIAKGYRMGRPEAEAVLSMQKLNKEGHTLIIFTGRAVQEERVRKAVEDWLVYFDIPFHGITNIKNPAVDVFVDDRGLRFHSWAQVLGDLKKIEAHPQPHTSNDNPVEGLLTDISKPLDAQHEV
jgi:hypothetical protein